MGRRVSWYSGSVTSRAAYRRVAGLDGLQVLLPPAEHRMREFGEVADFRDRLVVFVARQACQKPLVVRGDVAIDVGLRRQQSRDRDDQADRLDVAEPFLMGQGFRVTRHL